jgi:hypothetical protein
MSQNFSVPLVEPEPDGADEQAARPNVMAAAPLMVRNPRLLTRPGSCTCILNSFVRCFRGQRLVVGADVTVGQGDGSTEPV